MTAKICAFRLRGRTVKQLTEKSEPRFNEDQSDPAAPLPGFVTRTTLREILQKNGINNLLDLGTHSADLAPNESIASDALLSMYHSPER